ncbi:MAG TPA: hypothetical protein VLF66_06745, partial [Thermoanaerobaculia bacterium]|nr:hypothetical protein [Thermoanaerobaculia bacterium]
RRPRAFVRWTACAGGLLILLGGCVRPYPETVPERDEASPPADACRELERRVAARAPDAAAASQDEAEELLQRLLAALEDDPALRDCLARRMATGTGAPGR